MTKMKSIAAMMFGICLMLISPAYAQKNAKPAAPTLPAYFTLPASFGIASGGSGITFEDFGESEFYQPGSDDAIVKQGKHWYAPLELKNPPSGIEGKAIWAQLKPALLASGWTIPIEYDSNPFSAMMRYQKDGRDVWGYIKVFGSDDMRLNIVEIAQAASLLTINPPAAAPEKFAAEKGDFPYLPPLTGSTFKSGAHDPGTMEVALPGSDEVQVVGSGFIVKYYANLPTVSTVAFINAYHDALIKAGWTILSQNHGSDATLTAHYAAHGRDLWAYLHMGGEEYSIKVADVGSNDDLARQLTKDCHAALYGVLFDFNKATLKAESDGALQRVLALLQQDATLKLEVQGHTDNVGGDDYNRKLSDARASAVLAWLVQHGIAANRLSFKGYGKTVPVASNDTDAGRARNRRVEIAKPGCAK
ncbi:OmpA family protein [Pseudolysobacter antarcticus]|uniref:OmpA family protein n=1 Tax=Pseudolysobacter antarcticus TaxID=2511995 RepID=A0A411HK51_9GAMM|nr:OmpA family protein [Pseudolysobacter antarcticus]QBB70868.1 OmpA family protein [Pseudolysobacter antarcticus]